MCTAGLSSCAIQIQIQKIPYASKLGVLFSPHQVSLNETNRSVALAVLDASTP